MIFLCLEELVLWCVMGKSFSNMMSTDEVSRNTPEIFFRFHHILFFFYKIRSVVLFSWMIIAVFFDR